MNHWDDRYSKPGFAYGSEPNDFLVETASSIPTGPVLCLAEGEGRNAVYLAQLGYQVTAVDASRVGLDKAQQLATKNGVEIETIHADLSDFEIVPGAWSGIISIWAHLPPPLRKRIHRQVVGGLIAGGVFILEAYTEKQLTMPGKGGPPVGQKELLMSLAELREELDGLELPVAREKNREVNEGSFHHGLSAVVQVVATRKKQ